MKKLLFLTILLSSSIAMTPADFYSSQLKYVRVAEARRLKGRAADELLSSKGISTNHFDLFLRAFKKEKTLEVWAKNKDQNGYTLIKTYDFCASTGVLGPKRKSGDRQMPEGFYKIDLFNPTSQYLLSFRINYPNASDLKFADQLNPGDNIFIHGHCLTIGCIPIGDDNIRELYLLAIKAKSGGQTVPVHIFPAKMNEAGYASLKSEFSSNGNLLDFWANLKTGYDSFENTKNVPNVSVNANGKYEF